MNERRDWCTKKKNVYYVNEYFFERWSEDMAYVLGFFAADGNLTFSNKRKNYYIEFTSIDREILDKIKTILESEHKIALRKRSNPNWQNAYRLQIGSKKMFQDINRLGFTPKKSLTIKFPKIPPKYLSHFVRGYFDGDGYCSYGLCKRSDRPGGKKYALSGFVCGSKVFLEELREKLKENAKLTDGSFIFCNRSYRLVYSKNDSIKLYGFIYRNIEKNLYLERKFNKFTELRGGSSVG